MQGDPSTTPLRLLHLATTLRGGAGIAAVRLHDALRASGHASHIFTHEGAGMRDDVRSFETVRSTASIALSKVWHKVTTREKYYFRNDGWSLPDTGPLLAAAKEYAPDVIIAHFLTGFLDFDAVRELHEGTGAPIIFYLMDMAPLTGGCHFAWDCRGYERGCGNCPALMFSGPNDRSATTMRGKLRSLAAIHHGVITGANSLSAQARRSAVFNQSSIETIPLAVDQNLFRPRDVAAVRQKLGLDANRPVLFFASRMREQERKGLPVLKQALSHLSRRLTKEQLPSLLVAGDGPDFSEFEKEGYLHRSLGSVSLESLAECYAAADCFVSPSVEDSGPMMINEAAMSGTPIVAFDIGVAGDLIEDGKTGVIAKSLGDYDGLALCLHELLSWPAAQREHARDYLRRQSMAMLTPEAQSHAFARIAKKLLQRSSVRNSGELM